MGTPRAGTGVRRSQQEVRALLLRTARDRFATHGYAGASTRLIATEAGVSERLIFAYFQSKAGLFEAAVLEPFQNFVNDYLRQWELMPRTDTLDRETHTFIAGMFELLDRHGQLVRGLTAVRSPDSAALQDKITAAFVALLRPIEILVHDEVEHRGLTRFDAPLIARALVGMVMSLAVFDPLFYDNSTPHPARDHVVDQLTTLLVHGFDGFR